MDSPGSPLDLRLSPVVRRGHSDPGHNRAAKPNISRYHDRTKQPQEASEARPTFMQTVQETAKSFQQLRENKLEPLTNSGEASAPQLTITDDFKAECQEPREEISSTVNEKDDEEHDETNNNAKGDVWFTPSEYPAANLNIEEVRFIILSHFDGLTAPISIFVDI